MSLEQYLSHTAARVKVTLPISWGSERKVAYISMERDCAEAIPDDETMKMRVMELIDLCQQVADRRAPVPSQSGARPVYCKFCADPKTGLPKVEIKFQGKNPDGSWKPPTNPDGSPHVHKAKQA